MSVLPTAFPLPTALTSAIAATLTSSPGLRSQLSPLGALPLGT